MLGIGMQEILIILVVALIVIGPKRLPDLAKTLGRGFAEFRKAADDLQETVRLDLQKEKHEEFRQKYPDMVPDEDDKEHETSPEAESETGSKSKPVPESSPSKAATDAQEAMADKPEDKPEPEPSYNPEEIEGGDDMEDDNRDA